ncbi:MAG: coenzyme F420-0:L-glutamate ligase [Propionibacteriaceae bacterium]
MADQIAGEDVTSMIVFAPAGIAEVTTGTDLVAMILAAVAADPRGPLHPGDVVVVTSKIISKHEGRRRPAAELATALAAESVRTVTRRGPMSVVESRLGLVQPAAGIDRSNVDAADILLLPLDPDASAARLHQGLSAAVGGAVGVIVSDTAGRTWRLGQTDHALGAAGVRVVAAYAGRRDAYGNELQVTATALADELAAAGDLVKRKLGRRPVAVVRGLSALVGPDTGRAADLLRPSAEDLFRHGARESVLAALLSAVGAPERLEAVIALDDPAAIVDAISAGRGLTADQVELLTRSVIAACSPWVGA